MSNQKLYTSNFKTLSANGISLKDFNALSPEEAEAMVANLQEAVDSADPLEENSPADWDDNTYLNLDLEVDGKTYRLTGVRLDSDFVQYQDKEHTKPNVIAQSLLATINNKGVQYANENAKFKVTITKQGESTIEHTDELF